MKCIFCAMRQSKIRLFDLRNIDTHNLRLCKTSNFIADRYESTVTKLFGQIPLTKLH